MMLGSPALMVTLKLPGANGSGLGVPVIHDFLTDLSGTDLSTRIKPGQEGAYLEWGRRIAEAQAKSPGFRAIGASRLSPVFRTIG